ncbi:MAG: hypothetical protein GOU98_00920 [Candidatus Altiarchaeota archaeon]|nr:hypothetical protein [Candidatus Altiarchaeota archaeon]
MEILSEIQSEIMRNKRSRNFNVDDIAIELMCMVEEFGEFSSEYLSSNRAPRGEINNKDKLLDEIADVLIYAISICDILGEDALRVIKKKVEYNKTRTHKRF